MFVQSIPVLKNVMSYDTYISYVSKLVANKETSGEEQSEKLVDFTKLNSSRLKRISKTFSFTDKQEQFFTNISLSQEWIILVESWCGDVVQVLPILHKISLLNPKIKLKIVLRDENPELMDAFLTHGARAIPKVIMTLPDGTVKAVWGPRSIAATSRVTQYKLLHGKIDVTFLEDLQKWYLEDKGQAIVHDLVGIVSASLEVK